MYRRPGPGQGQPHGLLTSLARVFKAHRASARNAPIQALDRALISSRPDCELGGNPARSRGSQRIEARAWPGAAAGKTAEDRGPVRRGRVRLAQGLKLQFVGQRQRGKQQRALLRQSRRRLAANWPACPESALAGPSPVLPFLAIGAGDHIVAPADGQCHIALPPSPNSAIGLSIWVMAPALLSALPRRCLAWHLWCAAGARLPRSWSARRQSAALRQCIPSAFPEICLRVSAIRGAAQRFAAQSSVIRLRIIKHRARMSRALTRAGPSAKEPARSEARADALSA